MTKLLDDLIENLASDDLNKNQYLLDTFYGYFSFYNDPQFFEEIRNLFIGAVQDKMSEYQIAHNLKIPNSHLEALPIGIKRGIFMHDHNLGEDDLSEYILFLAHNLKKYGLEEEFKYLLKFEIKDRAYSVWRDTINILKNMKIADGFNLRPDSIGIKISYSENNYSFTIDKWSNYYRIRPIFDGKTLIDLDYYYDEIPIIFEKYSQQRV